MFGNFSRRTALSTSVCVAVLAAAASAQAQTFPTTIDFDLNWDNYFDLGDYNYAGVEGALGAVNTNLEQTALSQLNNAAARVAASYQPSEIDPWSGTGTGIAIDLTQDSGLDEGGIDLSAGNNAQAWTTQLDALLGGSQIAVTSFNTATVEFTAGGAGDIGLLALDQSLNGDTYNGSPYYPDAFDFNLSSLNQMDAVAAYAGNARIDGGIANPDFGKLVIPNPDYNPEDEASQEFLADTDQFLSSVQQAAASVNTLRVTSPVDVQLELSSQGFDVQGFSGREGYGYSGDYDQNFGISTFNEALAFSPRPSTTLSDPSIANLDQIAAISLNTMSFGTAATEEAAAGTEDYAVLVDTNNTFSNNVSLTGGGEAQLAGFNDYNDEVALGNTMVATTDPMAYGMLGGNLSSPYFDQREYGIGDVALSDVSQVAALTANSIRQNGTGDLTLQAGYFYGGSGEFDGAFYKDDFVQSTVNLDMEAGNYYDNGDWESGAVNLALSLTDEGNADISNLSQAVQFGFNSIASGGDINGWNDPNGPGIIQTSEESNPWVGFEYLNDADASTEYGNVTASGLDQIAQISFNTVSAAGDLNANLVQENDFELGAWDDLNNIWLDSDEEGNVTASGLSQIASVRLNSTSVEGAVTSSWLGQAAYDLTDVYFDEGINDLNAETYQGNASVDGIDQVAQLSINTLSAGSIATGSGSDNGINQYAAGLGSYDDYTAWEINEIDVTADSTGDASLANASQTYVLNMNTVSSAGSVSGDVNQWVEYANLDTDGEPQNSAYVDADQDLAGLRSVGGNASIDGLVQTLAANVNTFSAGSLDGANIDQRLGALYSPLENNAYVDSEWGAASADGIVQTAINRANYMSITTAK